MSWKTINAVLGLATIDEAFCEELLKNPVEAIRARKFVLSKEEEEKLSSIVASDLAEFSQQVLILFSRKGK
jgi:hypothetical protein